MTTEPHARRQAEVIRLLQDWLDRDNTSPAARIVSCQPAEGGLSSETWLLDLKDAAEGRALKWVLRIEPRDHQIYENASVKRQADLIRMIGRTADLPLPPVIAMEPDPLTLGAPFFIMQHAAGTAPAAAYHSQGVLADMSPADREAAWFQSIALMARLHALPTGPFAFLRWSNADGVTQELGRWDSYLEWSGLPRTDLLDRARQWLDDHRPSTSRCEVSWGDARPCNLLFVDATISAMLDWETASLGGAETDLGWWLAYDRMVSDLVGIPRLDGLPDADATIAAWEHAAGRKVEAMDWHLTFAAYRFALISEHAISLAVKAGRGSAALGGAGNPAVRLLDELTRG